MYGGCGGGHTWWGACVHGGGCAWQGVHGGGMHCMVDTMGYGNEWAVHILLECILVSQACVKNSGVCPIA